MKILNIYVINSTHLVNRTDFINKTLSKIKNCLSEKMKINFYSTQSPTSFDIQTNIKKYNERVKYEKEEGELADDDFHKQIQSLNLQKISNIEKHRNVLQIISKGSNDDLYLVLEDDVILADDYLQNVNELFDFLMLEEHNNKWDILLTCIAKTDEQKSLTLHDSIEKTKILINKSSYFIKPNTASLLFNYLYIFKYNLKCSISKFIKDNQTTIKTKILNKHTFLEGSKIGFFPTSVNNSNFLFQNMSYVYISSIFHNENDITDTILSNILQKYNEIKHFNNPDILYLMSKVYFKRKEYNIAKQYAMDACNEMKKQNGLISKSSEILNYTIDIFQYQEDLILKECKTKKSKYN